MTREIQDIPPAARHAHWRSVLWIRWPLALAGGAMTVLGGLWTWMLFLGSLGGQAADSRLDHGGVVTRGTVVSVTSTDRRFEGQTWGTVRYRMDQKPNSTFQCFAPLALRPNPDGPNPDGDPGTTAAEVPAGRLSAGSPCTIEHLAGDQNVNRILGGRRNLIPGWAQPQLYLGLVVAPGLLLLCLWAQGIFDARRLLAGGDVSVGEILALRRVQWVSPLMYEITYRFRDHRAQVRTARHWVRSRSSVGRRIREGADRLPVVVHRRWPRLSRLAVPGDFVRQVPAAARPTDGASLEA